MSILNHPSPTNKDSEDLARIMIRLDLDESCISSKCQDTEKEISPSASEHSSLLPFDQGNETEDIMPEIQARGIDLAYANTISDKVKNKRNG
jgi:hypothetical protein